MAIIDIARHNGSEVVFIKMPVNLLAVKYVPDQLQSQADGYIEKALVYAEVNEYKDAVLELKKATDLNPYSGKAFYYLGKYYAQMKKFDNAHEAFQQAIKVELFECEKLGKKYNQIMQEVANEEKVILVDIVSEFNEFRKTSTADLFLDVKNDTIHPSSAGHAVIGQTLYDVIMDNAFIR